MTGALLALALLAGFADDPTWDDGRAEVARYDAERVVYGVARPHQVVIITVKEDLDAATWVKADPPYGDRRIVPVLKLNVLAEIPTANYPYRYMTSAFARRDDPFRIVKVVMSSQEWCGTTYKSVVGRRSRWFSYFDGEAEGERMLDLAPGDLLADALPVQLRALPFRAGLERDVRLLDLLATNRGGREQVRDGRLRVIAAEDVDTGAGRIASWRVELAVGDQVDRLWFEREPPHVLTRLEAADGRVLRLRERRRDAYWQ